MDILQKIDPTLLDKTQVLRKQPKKINCVIWVVDFDEAKNTLYHLFGADTVVGEYPFLNALGLQIEDADLIKLSNFQWVEYVSSVQRASIFLDKARQDLDINDLHQMGLLGQNICVAVIDTGCYPHMDFVMGHNRIKYFKDFIGNRKVMYDDNGHGTFVAGVLGGGGLVRNGLYRGVAPACELVILKALNHSGETQAFTILNAMQWIVDNHKKYNIKVVCMSFGSIPLEKSDPLMAGAKVLWENGIVVVCASGNDGPEPKTIRSPGACPNVITVGSADIIKDFEHIKVALFSSRGPSFNYVKPDIIAPGVDIVSTHNSVKFYTKMSGTSVSTPFVAGMSALILGQNKHLSPNFIKSILMASALEMEEDKNACGSGLLNAKNIFLY